jgi:hypothetical protein
VQGPLVPAVVVAGDFAVGEWYGGGGGQQLFEKRDGHWRFVRGGGGQLGVASLRSSGVPEKLMCGLRAVDAACGARPPAR